MARLPSSSASPGVVRPDALPQMPLFAVNDQRGRVRLTLRGAGYRHHQDVPGFIGWMLEHISRNCPYELRLLGDAGEGRATLLVSAAGLLRELDGVARLPLVESTWVADDQTQLMFTQRPDGLHIHAEISGLANWPTGERFVLDFITDAWPAIDPLAAVSVAKHRPCRACGLMVVHQHAAGSCTVREQYTWCTRCGFVWLSEVERGTLDHVSHTAVRLEDAEAYLAARKKRPRR